MRLLVWLKKCAMRFTTVREFCRDCGRHVEQTWSTTDERWRHVLGIYWQGGRSGGVLVGPRDFQQPRCISCFDARCRRAWPALELHWVPMNDRRFVRPPPDEWISRVDHEREIARLSTSFHALIVSGSHTIDAAAALPELDGWRREHIDLEAALGELVAALGPFAVTARRAKAERRPA
jgi:hypothetical protein